MADAASDIPEVVNDEAAHRFEIKLGGETWPTSEHFFQAMKFVGNPDEEEVCQAKSPMIAARMGRSRKRPGSAGTSLSRISCDQAGWVTSPVPTPWPLSASVSRPGSESMPGATTMTRSSSRTRLTLGCTDWPAAAKDAGKESGKDGAK